MLLVQGQGPTQKQGAEVSALDLSPMDLDNTSAPIPDPSQVAQLINNLEKFKVFFYFKCIIYHYNMK